VQTRRNKFLAGTAFTNNQHRFVQGCKPRHMLLHLQKIRGFANHAISLIGR
jgi:hypothetical protein